MAGRLRNDAERKTLFFAIDNRCSAQIKLSLMRKLYVFLIVVDIVGQYVQFV
jgi:hypothetical protein